MNILVLSSAAGLRRHAATLDDPLRAFCGARTDGWQITVLAAGGVDCLRCIHQLRRRDVTGVSDPELLIAALYRRTG